MKDFPARIKEDNAKLAVMSKAFINLNKTHQSKALSSVNI